MASAPADAAADAADAAAAAPVATTAAAATAAAAAHLRSEGHFLCSICLDVFTNPVSTPCGHNFCKGCIAEHWKTKLNCPMCKQGFSTKPQLKTNCLLSEMVHEFRHQGSKRKRLLEDVLCDVCTGTKETAVKSCLECLTSYCETHLEPHRGVPGLRGHQLIQPVENLGAQKCPKHGEPMEFFCKTDQTGPVCVLCTVLDHKGHTFFLMEYVEKKKKLKQDRRVKVQEMRRSLMVSQEDADIEKAEGVEIFTALKESVQKDLDQFLQECEDKLLKRSSEVEQLSLSEERLRNLATVNTDLPTKNWTEVRVRPPSYERTVVRAVAKLKKTISEQMKELKKKVELKKVQQFAVDLTLDPDTAHPRLALSEDGKQIHWCHEWKELPQNPQRFSGLGRVLAKESFSSGRFYFEVQVKGNPIWDLGVARESVNRTGEILLSPQEGFWQIRRRHRRYLAGTDPPVRLSVESPPEKVGVFVDYDEGLVSFYDADAADLLYTFTDCSFSDKLHPFFAIIRDGRIPAPLIICPVNQTF